MKQLIIAFLSLVFVEAAISAPEKIFRFRLLEDPHTLDWNYGEVSTDIVYQLMEGLFVSDKDGKPTPALLKSFRWGKKQVSISFELKNRLYWSDGEPLCAQHFVDSWNRLKSKELASPYAHYGNILKSFSAKGCSKLNVRLSRKAPEFLAMLTHYVFFPIRLDALKKNPKMFVDGEGLVVNGPFVLDKWKRDQSLSLKANPQYRKKWQPMQKIEALILPEATTAMALYEQGKIDWMRDVPPLLRKNWRGKADFRVYPTLIAYYLGLNRDAAPALKNKSVRYALSAVLERDQMNVVIGEEAKGIKRWLIPKVLPQDKLKKVILNYDLTKVKKTLAKADHGLVIYVYNKPVHKRLAEWLQAQWSQHLEIDVPIRVLEEKVYWRDIYFNHWPIFLSGITAPYNHPRAFLQEFLKNSTANWTGWSSKLYDSNVDKNYFAHAESILHRSGVVVPLYSRATIALVNPKWKNFWINPLGQVYLQRLKATK